MSNHFQWQSPVHWFGVTLGSSIWLAISAAVLLARGHALPGAVFAAAYLLLAVLAAGLWSCRRSVSCYAAWQWWFGVMGISSLAAVAAVHLTGTYPAINIDEVGLLLLYVGIALGVPLLMLDFWSRERSNGEKGIFSALFDIIASFF